MRKKITCQRDRWAVFMQYAKAASMQLKQNAATKPYAQRGTANILLDHPSRLAVASKAVDISITAPSIIELSSMRGRPCSAHLAWKQLLCPDAQVIGTKKGLRMLIDAASPQDSRASASRGMYCITSTALLRSVYILYKWEGWYVHGSRYEL